jgi:hypothetical protein
MPNIQITDLIDNAVENALARREEALTTEEANQIQGGKSFTTAGGGKSFTTAGGRIVKPWIIFGGFFA